MTYQLVLFASLNPKPPCFVIPVFTTASSNGTFAQDLHAGGTVREFMKFSADDFTIVNAIAPVVKIVPGDEGMIAFWFEDGEVACGTAKELKNILRTADMLTSSPFVEVERATFLEDHALLAAAAATASLLLDSSSARDSYHARVRERIKTLKNLREQEEAIKETDKQDLSSLIKLLEIEKDSQRWTAQWREGWIKFKQDQRLVDVARWRMMTIGLGDDEASVLGDMRYKLDSGVQELNTWWLNNRSYKHPGWILVWDMSDDDGKEFPPATVVDALELLFRGNVANINQWTMLGAWSSCFRMIKSEKARIIDVAVRNDGKSFYSEYFVERIVWQIYNDDIKNKWAETKLKRWFMSVKGTSGWVRMFSLAGNEVLTPKEFLDTATKWLRRYGRGTNKWIDIYRMVKHNLGKEEDWNIRVAWLNRARKDLFTWPEVFESLADDSGDENVRELSEIACSWEFQGREHRSNDTIEDFASR